MSVLSQVVVHVCLALVCGNVIKYFKYFPLSVSEMDVLEDSPVPSPIREPSVEPEREPSVEPESPTPETKEDRLQEDATEEKSSTGGTRRRRTRKLVPKTYMDESGFMGEFTSIKPVKITHM